MAAKRTETRARSSDRQNVRSVRLAASLVLLHGLPRAHLQRRGARLHGLRRDSLLDFLCHLHEGLFDVRGRLGARLEERNAHLVRERLCGSGGG